MCGRLFCFGAVVTLICAPMMGWMPALTHDSEKSNAPNRLSISVIAIAGEFVWVANCTALCIDIALRDREYDEYMRR